MLYPFILSAAAFIQCNRRAVCFGNQDRHARTIIVSPENNIYQRPDT